MSENRIYSELSKRGSWGRYHRKFSNLSDVCKRIAVSLIQGGDDPATAIKRAKKAVQCTTN